jgi:hypothetical protein
MVQVPTFVYIKVKDALVVCSPLFTELTLPTESEFTILEDLVAALRPVEILTAKLCEANFNVLKVSFESTKRFFVTFSMTSGE